MKNLSNTKAQLKKSVAYKKSVYTQTHSVSREVEAQFIKRLSNAEAEFNKCVAYKKT